MMDLKAIIKMCALRQTMNNFMLSTNFSWSPFLMPRITLMNMMMALLSRGFYSRLTFSNFLSVNYFSSILRIVFWFSIEINLFR